MTSMTRCSLHLRSHVRQTWCVRLYARQVSNSVDSVSFLCLCYFRRGDGHGKAVGREIGEFVRWMGRWMDGECKSYTCIHT